MNLRLLLLLPCLSFTVPAAVIPKDSPRWSPAVEWIQRSAPAILPIFSLDNETQSLGSGTGVLIHPAGYVLTADHVTQGRPGYAVRNLERVPYQVVGRLPEKDISILKLQGNGPWHFLPLGRSEDCQAGETILVGGNPGGRGLTFTVGIISSPSIDPTWPNLFAKTFFRSAVNDKGLDGRDDFIQFDAASNRGNSGGPLINAAGEIIGVVASKKYDEEAINWAIPADRIRKLFDHVVQPEVLHGFQTGLKLDPLSDGCQVLDVLTSSPAQDAGLKAGDQLEAMDGQVVHQATDLWLLLFGKKPGDILKLKYRRGGKILQTSLTLSPFPFPKTPDTASLKPGLQFSVFHGEFVDVPDFQGLPLESEGVTESLEPDSMVAGEKDHYAIQLKGYLQAPKPGIYRMEIVSDDGAKLYIQDQLILNNGGTHPPIGISRLIRLPDTPVPLRLDYFESTGGAELKIRLLTGAMQNPREVPFRLLHASPAK